VHRFDGSGTPMEGVSASAGTGAASEPRVVSLNRAGQLYLGLRPLGAAELEAELHGAASTDSGVRDRIAADARVLHARVVDLVALCRRAGITRIRLLTEAP
jgi:biopolymer transport protein ExbD